MIGLEAGRNIHPQRRSGGRSQQKAKTREMRCDPGVSCMWGGWWTRGLYFSTTDTQSRSGFVVKAGQRKVEMGKLMKSSADAREVFVV